MEQKIYGSSRKPIVNLYINHTISVVTDILSRGLSDWMIRNLILSSSQESHLKYKNTERLKVKD